MRPEIREDVEPFARNLHNKKWKSSERDAIRDEFFLTEEEADATAEILIELEKSDRKSEGENPVCVEEILREDI